VPWSQSSDETTVIQIKTLSLGIIAYITQEFAFLQDKKTGAKREIKSPPGLSIKTPISLSLPSFCHCF